MCIHQHQKHQQQMKYDAHWDSTDWADNCANVQQLQVYSGPSPRMQLEFLSNFFFFN